MDNTTTLLPTTMMVTSTCEHLKKNLRMSKIQTKLKEHQKK